MGAQVVDELGWFDLVESKTDKVKAFAAKKVTTPTELIFLHALTYGNYK